MPPIPGRGGIMPAGIEGIPSARTTVDKRRVGPYVIERVLPGGRACKLVLNSGDLIHHTQPVSRLEPVKKVTCFRMLIGDKTC